MKQRNPKLELKIELKTSKTQWNYIENDFV